MKLIMFDNVLIEDVIVSQFHVPDPQKKRYKHWWQVP